MQALPRHSYDDLVRQYTALVAETRDAIANAANLAAVVYHNLEEVNWAGFYFLRGDRLVLGPFQGKAACVEIAVGKGVCGTAAVRREPVVVPNVHEFPGHIACDTASNAEVVVPIVIGGRLLGVFDIDSPQFNRFTDDDARGLLRLVAIWAENSDPLP